MNRPVSRETGEILRVPRASGDEPKGAEAPPEGSLCSPRERG